MIQEEATTGRPDGVVEAGLGGETDLSPRMQRLLGQWEDYNEEERTLLQEYEGGFSGALQRQSKRMKSHMGKFTREINEFWRARERQRYWHGRYRKYGSSRYKRRRREWTGKAERSYDKLQRLANLPFRSMEWQPSTPESAPGHGSVLFATGVRSLASPQVRATTKRPGEPPSELSYLGLLGEEEAATEYQQRMGELGQKRSAARAGLGEKYSGLLSERSTEHKRLQRRVDKAMRRVKKVGPQVFI
jgi:hypothetical protein